MDEPGAVYQADYKERIKQLELEARPLDPGTEDRALLRDKVIAFADEFLEGIDGSPAYVVPGGEDSTLYDSPISEGPTDAEVVLNLLDRGVTRGGVNVGSAGHLAYIPGSTLYASALADYLAAVTNRYTGLYFASPGAVRMERVLLRWMSDFLGYPATSAGDLTSGGSIANLVGIVTAREAHDLKARDFERAVVYLSDQTHHAIDKALRIAGLEESIKRFVPLDGRHRMRPEALEKAVGDDKKAGLLPWLIAATAGTTDTGAVDPLEELADIARHHGLWLHVDGAYGATFALTGYGKRMLKGIERSDSVVLDPHKGMFLPFGSGAVLVREARHLLDAHHYHASYLQDKDALASADEVSPADLSPELTRPFRALRLWLPLKLAGVAPFRAALEEKLLLARHFHETMRLEDGFEVGAVPDLSIVTFRYLPRRGDPDAFNRRLIDAVQRDGRVFVSSTMIGGRFTLRMAILSLRTHLDTVEQAIEILREKAKWLQRDA
ncbi:MAG: aminotransferase class I/II-fold pyridoxal phosphate-dependent enzyme [Actinomycetota bacterium]|nr:aminotransferase class I/II-fold pyridoxal phosphate-dependent enzyme [Actinomycetota bacterium]